MSNLVKTNNHFSHELFGSLTTITNDAGDVFFVAKEVATTLGYSNPHEAIRTHFKGVSEILTPTKGGEQMVKIIPERDLYRLVIKSKKPEAEKFEEWVVGEVLPTIRKTGTYGTAALPNFNDPYEAAIAWANEYKAKQEALTELGEVKNQLENVTIALDAHENWLSILAVSIANNINEKSLDWRNLYHIDVFRAVYPKLHLSGIRDMNILA